MTGLGEAYDTKNVGTGKTLTPFGSVNDGNGGNNYTITTVNDTSGVISKAFLTITVVSNMKVYDGTGSATAQPTITSGALATGDTAAFTETYDTRNVGTGKTLTPSGSVNDGNGGNNYQVTVVPNTAGAITARAITMTVVAVTKTYDGTSTSSATPTVTSGSLVGGDTLATETFDNRNVGTGKMVTASGLVSDGNGGNNYQVTLLTTTALGAITARAIMVTAAANTKTYDGTSTSSATPTVTGGSLVSGDTLVYTETFDNRNEGTGKTLTASGSVSDGNGGNNYLVTLAPSTAGKITARAITLTALAVTKAYDGTTTTSATPTLTGGSLVGSDALAYTETFLNRNAGSGKTLTASGSMSDGNGGNNYQITLVPNTAGQISPVTPNLFLQSVVANGANVLPGGTQTVMKGGELTVQFATPANFLANGFAGGFFYLVYDSSVFEGLKSFSSTTGAGGAGLNSILAQEISIPSGSVLFQSPGVAGGFLINLSVTGRPHHCNSF